MAQVIPAYNSYTQLQSLRIGDYFVHENLMYRLGEANKISLAKMPSQKYVTPCKDWPPTQLVIKIGT